MVVVGQPDDNASHAPPSHHRRGQISIATVIPTVIADHPGAAGNAGTPCTAAMTVARATVSRGTFRVQFVLICTVS